jgi:peptidoglycan hydrolase-like protein with peptidoglycan-binding domain
MDRALIAVVPALALALALPAQAPAFADRTLHPGLSGDDVRTAQVLLRRVTSEAITIDGVYGPQTERVARQFELSNALGVNGRLTRGEQQLLRQFADRAVAERRAAALAAPAGAAAVAAPPAAPSPPTAPATLNADGTATPPAGAPAAVAQVIAAGNEIATKPYRYGGGHAKLVDTGYDCSGSASYALRGAGLMEGSMPSYDFEDWGDPGPGAWVTVYARKDHMYLVVAGLRFDTSGARPSRWQAEMRPADGYVVRHPTGL